MFCLFVALLLGLPDKLGSDGVLDWSYGSGSTGPANWCKLKYELNQCCGLRQSPINIDTTVIVPADFVLKTKGLHYKWEYVEVTNDHYTVIVRVPNKVCNTPSLLIWTTDKYQKPIVSDKYLFDSMRFHFGNTSCSGSEHLIDGQAFPMEMHSVFYNSKYSSLWAAKNHADGLVVLGTLFYISKYDNVYYDGIIEGLKNVVYLKERVHLKPGFPISDLLPKDLCSAFSYEGSLTTPICNEAVHWFVLKNRIPISECQLKHFRALTVLVPSNETTINKSEYLMANNYRPVQPLNNRTIYHHCSMKR